MFSTWLLKTLVPLAEMVLDAASDGSENNEPEVSDVDIDEEEDEEEEGNLLANSPADAAGCPFVCCNSW